MEYKQKDDKIIMTDFDSFNIKEILECGQCFRFTKLDENEYIIIAKNRVLNIKQNKDEVYFYPCDKKDFEQIWINYFDLNRDYAKIKELLSNDKILKKAIDYAGGIRILNQQPWECLISFIISQNNRIPMIKQVIKNISEKYGEKSGDYYFFPDKHSLANADILALTECKTGFRAKYIIDAAQKINSNLINLESLRLLSSDEARQKLILIKGVGPKVADCTLLFSLGKTDVFPTDVWVKRVMEHFYFNGSDTPIKEIHNFAKNTWSNLSGFAQQYLFYYARSLKIGAKK